MSDISCSSPPGPEHTQTLIALSLLPFGWRRALGEQLRSGKNPATILIRLLAEKPKQPGVDWASLMARAAAAISRGAAHGVHPVPWDAASYPAALTAIVDPPPVLWARGNPAALSSPAVAIVGSRAGSEYSLAVAERLA